MLYSTLSERYKALTADQSKLLEDVIFNDAYKTKARRAKVLTRLRATLRSGFGIVLE